MKKILILLIFIFSIFISGCSGNLFENNTVEYENQITLKLDDDYASFVDGEIPNFIFEFDGKLTVNADNKYSMYVEFYNEDGYILSDALAKLFDKYRDNMHVEEVSKNTGVTKAIFTAHNEYGAVQNIYFTPDDYCEYNEKAFINLENGLKLMVQYRRFLYNGKTYYTWQYGGSVTRLVRIDLIFPFMVIENDSPNALTNKLVLISLPTRISPNIYNNIVAEKQINISKLINGSTYTYSDDSMYYNYSYVEVSTSEDEHQQILDNQQYIIDYYVNELNGRYLEEEVEIIEDNKTTTKVEKYIYYSYLGNDFKIQLYDSYFKMMYLGKTE